MSPDPIPITEVRVKLTGDGRSKLRAYCSITLGDQFVIRDLKIIEGNRGAFVAMPSRKVADHCPQCRHKNHLRARFCNECGGRLDPKRADRHSEAGGRTHADLAHPINSKARIRLHRAILAAYAEEVEKSSAEGYQPASFDDLDAQSDSSEDEYIAELQRRHADRERRRQSGADGDLAAGDAAGF